MGALTGCFWSSQASAICTHGSSCFSASFATRSTTRRVEVALELMSTLTLPGTLRATAVHGVVCFTGMLSH